MSVADAGQWRRSSRCEATQCVEIAQFSEHVMLRDSADPAGPTLTFSRVEWEGFAASVRGGEFDLQ